MHGICCRAEEQVYPLLSLRMCLEQETGGR